jgi:Nucleotidyltransferase domain
MTQRAAVTETVVECVTAAPGVVTVEPVGSRATGTATAWSDWDFGVVTDDFERARTTVPEAVQALNPVVAQWDRLSDTWCYMLILPGPAKVDLIFAEPHEHAPPWTVTAATLPGIDAHFWDWALWLRSKEVAGRTQLLAAELAKLHEHLLAPMGSVEVPASLDRAIQDYRTLRSRHEAERGRHVPRAVEHTVMPLLQRPVTES